MHTLADDCPFPRAAFVGLALACAATRVGLRPRVVLFVFGSFSCAEPLSCSSFGGFLAFVALLGLFEGLEVTDDGLL